MKDDNTLPVDHFVAFLSPHIRVSEEEKAALSSIIKRKTFRKNEIIHREGDTVRNIALLVEGSVRYFYTDEKGEEQTVSFVFENEIVGDYRALMNIEGAIGAAEALENCTFFGITYDGFTTFMMKFPRYYPVLTTLLSNAFIALDERDKLLRILSSRERYEQLCKTRPDIVQRVSVTHIASYLRMALGTLSRVRAGKL